MLSACCIGLFMRLGVWQWSRGLEKAAILKRHGRTHPLKDLNQGVAVKPGDSVRASGHFDNQHSFLLDNQFYQHRVGFNVLTPLKLENGHWILVDRGWVPAKPNRRDLPDIHPLTGHYTFNGEAYMPSDKARVLSERLDNEGTWPLIIEKVTLTKLSKRLDIELLPFIIRLDKGATFGYTRAWQVVSMPPERHYGYAMQWFTFALVALVLFVYLNVEKKRGGE